MRTNLVALTNALYKLLSTSVVFFWAVYFKEIGFSGLQIGAIIAAMSITGIVFINTGGLLNDRIKSKSLISIAILLITIEFLGVSQTVNFWSIFALFVLGGFAGTLYGISTDSILLKTLKEENRQEKIGMFLSLGYVGIGTGMILGGYFLGKIGFDSLLKIISVGFAVVFAISFFLPNTSIDKPKLIEYKQDLLRKEVLFFILMIFLFALHYGAENTTYGLFLRHNLNLSMGTIGLYMGGGVLTMAISVLIFSNFAQKKENIAWILYVGLFLSGIGFIGMTIPENVTISFLFRVTHEIGDTAMFIFLYNGLSKFFPVQRLGGNTSVVTLTTIVAGSLSAFVCGPLGEKFGYNVPLVIAGSICILTAFLAIYARHLIKHE